MYSHNSPSPSGHKSLKFPWVALMKVSYLSSVALGIFRLRTWSPDLLIPVLTAVLPALLHLALVLPKPHPVLARSPYLLRWVYGLPLVSLAAPWLVHAVAPILGGHYGYEFGFHVHAYLKTAPAGPRLAALVVAVGLLHVLIEHIAQSVRADGWRRGIIECPLATIGAVLLGSVCSGVALAALYPVLKLSPLWLHSASQLLQAFLASAGWAASWTVLVLFPAAIFVSLLRGDRGLRWQS